MEFLGAVAGGDARPHGGVGVHTLAGGGTRQELGENLDVLEAGDQLLDAHQGDERVGQGQAHAAVALGLEDRDRAGFRDAHVGAGDSNLGVQELLTQVGACRGGQLGRIVGEVARSVLHAIQEDATNLGTVSVDRGDHDVAGHVVGQLDDHLGEVGLASVNALFLQVLVEVRLLGGHGFDLDDLVDTLGLDDVRDDAVGLVLVARPVDDATASGHVAFELFEELGHAGLDLELDGLGCAAQVLPVGHFRDALSALGADRAGGVAQVAAHLGVGQGLVGAFREGRAPAEGVLGDGDGGAPSAGVRLGGGGHSDERCGHVRSPVRFRVRRRCCPRRADPWWMPGFRRGASGGCPS